jgi:hypothetical protein
MTTKQEETLLAQIVLLKNKLQRIDKKISYATYNQIKIEQEQINDLLNSLLQYTS